MLSLIVSLLGLSPSTNLYLSKATAHCANATLEPCSYTLYINHDTDNPGVLPVLRYLLYDCEACKKHRKHTIWRSAGTSGCNDFPN